MDLYISCEQCRRRFIPARSTARFCGGTCRQRFNRATKREQNRLDQLPYVMLSRRSWVRARGKVPLQVDGRYASSTNPATWSTFKEVQASTAGDGFGIMLGDGLGCIDLDGCIGSDGVVSDFAKDTIASITEPVLFIEHSMSGRGLHIFIAAPEGPGVTRAGYERYTRQRFIRTTGEAAQGYE